MKNNIIITGKANVGKTTLAKAILNQYEESEVYTVRYHYWKNATFKYQGLTDKHKVIFFEDVDCIYTLFEILKIANLPELKVECPYKWDVCIPTPMFLICCLYSIDAKSIEHMKELSTVIEIK